MNGRVGGRIGQATSLELGGTSGVWRLADVYAAKTLAYGQDQYYLEPPWPAISMTVTLLEDVDATLTGGGTFTADVEVVAYGYGYLDALQIPFRWEVSDDSGTTWYAVESGVFEFDFYNSNQIFLEVTGQTGANNGDWYRIVLRNGLKTVISPWAALIVN